VTGSANRVRLAAVLVGFAAAIHISAGVEHLEEWWVFAIVFLLTAALQAAWSIVVWRRSSRRLLLLGLMLNGGIAIVWLFSRTTGLPIGPESFTRETIGLVDAQSTVNELLGCVLIASCLLAPLQRLRSLVSCSEVLALTAVGMSFLLLASGAGHAS
jgi:hypothetical protein